MNRDRTHRPEQDPIRGTASAGQRRPAPGKVTLTSKLSPGRGSPAQRKASATDGEASPASRPAARPVSRLAMDSLMDVAHRGLSALPEAAPAGGQPMPAAVQAKMDRAFGTDFSGVRIHQGSQARAMGALAYTQGTDIHFASGQYDPSSQRGQELLGHELAHVVQQGQGRVQATTQAKGLGINDDAALEREADVMGARAARGESVGGQAPAPGAASRDSGAPVQRMIDGAAPAVTTWDEIQRYLHSKLINERKQTFAEAVDEYIVTQAEHYDQVQSKWQALAQEAVRQGKVDDALRTIQEIIQLINTTKTGEPDHPNKPGSGPDDEQYGTIPQSAESKRIAFELRAEFLATMYGAKYDAGANTYDGNRIDGVWKKDFMLGVLMLPDGSTHVSHSGFMGRTQSDLFTQIVTDAGYEAATHDANGPYSALQGKYKGHLQHDIPMPGHHRMQDEVKPSGGRGGRGRGGRGRGGHGRGGRGGRGGGGGRTTTHVFHYDVTGTNVIEKGNPLGVCAAPQGLHTVDEMTTGNDFPAKLEGETPMALTEVLVRNSNQGVTVKDKAGHEHEYKDDNDVPSCLSCQVQLRFITKLLTDRRRNVVNRQNIRARNGEDITSAVTLLENVLAETRNREGLVERILGKGGGASDIVGQDLEKLRDAKEAYRTALNQAAKELTARPELVESGQTHPGAQKTVHDEQRKALAEKRRITGSLIKPDAYANAREEASTALGVGARAEEASTERAELEALQVQEEQTTLARAERELGKLSYYEEHGYLTAEQETHYQRELSTKLDQHRDASRELAGASKDVDKRSLHDLNVRVERLMPALRGLVWSLDHDLRASEARIREQRSEEFARAAEQSSQRRDSRALEEQGTRERGEDALRRAAETSARSSSQHQEDRAEEEARRLEDLAFGIAQFYDTSIARALELLTQGGTDGPYTPERDDSKTSHMYG